MSWPFREKSFWRQALAWHFDTAITPGKIAVYCLATSIRGEKFFSPKMILEINYEMCDNTIKTFLVVLWNYIRSAIWFFFAKYKLLHVRDKMFLVKLCSTWYSKTFNTYQKSVFSWYVWHSTTTSGVHKHFYFIPNEKYGPFLTFCAPS